MAKERRLTQENLNQLSNAAAALAPGLVARRITVVFRRNPRKATAATVIVQLEPAEGGH